MITDSASSSKSTLPSSFQLEKEDASNYLAKLSATNKNLRDSPALKRTWWSSKAPIANCVCCLVKHAQFTAVIVEPWPAQGASRNPSSYKCQVIMLRPWWSALLPHLEANTTCLTASTMVNNIWAHPATSLAAPLRCLCACKTLLC